MNDDIKGLDAFEPDETLDLEVYDIEELENRSLMTNINLPTACTCSCCCA